MAALLLLVEGCSWMSSGNYFYCQIQADEIEVEKFKAEDFKITCEEASNEESKEVENPGL